MSFLKIKIHPGLIAALIGGIGAFLLTQLQINPFLEGTGSSENTVPVEVSEATPEPGTTPTPSQSVAAPKPITGGLRVRNQTSFPVRLVLMESRPATAQNPYQEPVHWNFAPAEGSEAGLILSLPGGNLRLEKGDILLGFALDGSGRYWGPFVVDQTPLPEKGKSGEWQLTLRP